MKTGSGVSRRAGLSPASPLQLERPLPRAEQQPKVRTFKDFANKMRPELPEMKGQQRERLLKELYWLVVAKRVMDEVAPSNRAEAVSNRSVYRPYRMWMAAISKKLENVVKAMEEVRMAANNQPPKDQTLSVDDDKATKEVVKKTTTALARTGNALSRSMADIRYYESTLSAAIHPSLRTAAEKRLVPREPKDLKHRLFVSEKTREIDLTFSRRAARVLGRYCTKTGKPIPRDKTIARLFFAAFGITKQEDSIRRDLSRHRVGAKSRNS